MREQHDTISYFQTPEGVELSLTLAGPLVRAAAWIIDMVIRVVCYILISIVLELLGGVGRGIILISLFCIEWFYPVIFEVTSGMTPGKRAMSIKVVHDNGTPVGLASSLLRNLIRTVDFLPLFNVVGSITMVLNSRFKRLGDIAAGTLVVYTSSRKNTGKVEQRKPQPSPIPLRLEEQRLILDFCERSTDLTPSRRKELAGLLTPLTGSDSPEEKLLSFGNWFLKGRGEDESASV